jgi:hypothetical protein
MTDPDAVYLAEWEAERDAHALADGSYVDPSEDFWTARPELAHILAVARARRAGPWATLGVVMTRIVAQTPPRVVLPKTGSLNLFVGLIGRSGEGKGQATSAANRAFTIFPAEFHTAGLGSGEGLAHLYAKRVKEAGTSRVMMHTTSVLFDVPEVDTIAALSSRNSATILAELRKGWSGEALGFSYADPDKRLPIPEHTYRLCLTAGIQPKRAAALLDDSDGGTPQRFIWLPVIDPYAPQVAPEMPEPWEWKVPAGAEHQGWKIDRSADSEREESERIEISVCETALRQTDAHRLSILRGESGIDEIDTHAMFSRLKIGAALGLMAGRLTLSDEDWELAGVIKGHSDRQRESVRHAIAEVARVRNLAQGRAEGERAAVASEIVESKALARVIRNVLRRLRAADGWVASNELRKTSIASRDRALFEPALVELLASNEIAVSEVEGGLRYRSL